MDLAAQILFTILAIIVILRGMMEVTRHGDDG